MNLTTVKTLKEVHLAGITVEWTKEDKSVKEIRLRDTNGGRLVIRAGTYGDVLKVMVPQAFEEEDRFVLSGRFLDLCDVREFFESKYDAEAKLGEYRTKAGHADHGLTVEQVSVQINDAGQVIEQQKGAAKTTDDEIPF
jgi:hypothetical protein